ncbi:MAG: PIG-L deacetylase family protein [Planctomycetota bacterium]
MFLRTWEPLFAPRDLVQGSLLVVAPHPDDEVIGAGGLILAHRDADAPVHVTVMTDGRLGDFDGRHGEGYVERRREECRAAAIALGGAETEFLDFPDGGLVAAMGEGDPPAPVAALAARIAGMRPATLAFPSPWELHPDHRAAALAALAAARVAGHAGRLLAYEVGTFMPSNLLIDTTHLFARKIEALRCYASQLEHHDLVAKLTGVDVARTANVDDPAVTRAEAYLRVDPAEIETFLAAVESAARITDRMAPGIPYA